jgi:hypothetical protein
MTSCSVQNGMMVLQSCDPCISGAYSNFLREAAVGSDNAKVVMIHETKFHHLSQLVAEQNAAVNNTQKSKS